MAKKNFNFDAFYACASRQNRRAQPNFEWLTWFVGFVEGEGSFIVAKRGDLSLVVVQSLHNVSVLHHIQKRLEIGRVIIQSKTLKSVGWIVQDALSLRLIISIFNGNMVLPSRHIRFKTFCSSYNAFVLKPRKIARPYPLVTVLDQLASPSVQDAWLAGFTDGEGCFYARFTPTSYKLTYSVSQKYLANKPSLERIQQLFQCGTVCRHSAADTWTFVAYGLQSNARVINYFKVHKLKTKKRRSFMIWCYLHEAISLGAHRTAKKQLLVDLCFRINPKIDTVLLSLNLNNTANNFKV